MSSLTTPGGVPSVFARTGAVVAGNADYLAVASGGLTGATAATRFVGGTVSGAPASGTFAVGDFVIDQTGKVWVCTVAGSPGTWVTAGAVSSVFGRSGAVTAQSGDYTAAQVTNAADKSSGSAQAFTGNLSAPAMIAAGLTGATAATRHVGGTASGAPVSGTFAVGDFVIDQTGKVWICTVAGSPGTWIASGGGVPQDLWMPTGAIAENFRRAPGSGAAAMSALSSGRLSLFGGMVLPAGRAINNINFYAGTTGATATNQWACLVDQSLNVLVKSNDLTTATWAGTTKQTFPLASPFTPSVDTPVYVGLVVVGTVPQLQGVSIGVTGFIVDAPMMTGTSTTGLTNPASLGATAGATSSNTNLAYCYVS